MASNNTNNDSPYDDFPETRQLYVNTISNNISSEVNVEEKLYHFNTLISELDEIGRNLKYLKTGYGRYGNIGEGPSRGFENAGDSPSNHSIRKTTSLASVYKETYQNKDEEKNKQDALEEIETNNTQLNGFVLPALLKERDEELESSEEEQYRKSEFLISLLMSSLFPPSYK